MPFEISSLATAKEADLEILNADGSGTGWIWTFAGPGHPATIDADNKQSQRFLDRETDKERAQVNNRKWKIETPKVAERRADGIAYVVARLLRWNDGMTMEGEPFPFTPENATKVLSNPDMGSLYDQANAFLMAEKSFSKRSA